MIYLERPASLLLLFLIPIFLWFRKTGMLSKPAFPLILRDWGGQPLVWRSPWIRFLRVVSISSLYLTFLCVIFALAGPVKIHRESIFSGTGNTVLFVLDVSPSMAAKDMDTLTRLETGRQYIRSFVSDRPGTAFGLSALGSTAALLVPPTADHKTFLERLDALTIGEFGDGTALGLGITVAAAHTVSYSENPATVILITDGENNAGEVHPETAARLLVSRGIDLYVLGIGSRGSVPVEYLDPISGTHYSGVLESDYNEAALIAIATAGGGTFVSAQDRKGLQDIFDILDRSIPVVRSSWTRTIETSLANDILIFALILAAVSWVFRRVFMGAVL
ncbi:MAG TPA: VWA domain-containing protein [Treponema sp.]|nr:VWA domain-containing protein [Treponema sp.]